MKTLHVASLVGLVSSLYGCNIEVCEAGASCQDLGLEEDGRCAGDPHGDGGASSGGAAPQASGGSNAGGWGGGASDGGGNVGGASSDGGSNASSSGGAGEGGAPVACVKSCECAVGEVCADGVCQPRTPAPISCSVDCDCPSGSLCADGLCRVP